MADGSQEAVPGDAERSSAAKEPSAGSKAAATAPTSTDSSVAVSDRTNVDALLDQAQAALSSLDETAAPLPPGIKPFELKDLLGTAPANEAASMDLLRDVQLDLKIELGRTQMHLEEVLRLKQGAVVTLNKLAGDPVDIYANGRLIARGEVLVLNDNFCVRVAELIAGEATE
ncbi:MAG TPA: flagellar motor switch protein FliN [Lacipirellulaceae bacterium]|nr:flagellar motor switch protein FliN [Lacipirellulaceae bacterium]